MRINKNGMSPRLTAQKLVRPPSRSTLHIFLILREKFNQIIYAVPFFSSVPTPVALPALLPIHVFFLHCYCRYLYSTHIAYRFHANLPTYICVCGKYRTYIVLYMYHILYMTYKIHSIHALYIGYIMYSIWDIQCFACRVHIILYVTYPQVKCVVSL